jgi:hypothetical protein
MMKVMTKLFTNNQ